MKLRIAAIHTIIALLICSPAMACTIFCFTHNGKTFFCNNEDWRDPITEIRFNPATDTDYAWVYLGFSNNWSQGGVNEHGLCYDWVAGGGPFDWETDSNKVNFVGNLSEEMLRKCRNVDEAIAFYQKYNERHLDGGRTLVADRDGNSVFVHWRDGKLRLEKKTDQLHSCGVGKEEIDSRLGALRANPSLSGLAQSLSDARTEGKFGTKYSNIMSLSDGKMQVFQNRDYTQFLEIDFASKLKEKSAVYRISDLFQSSATVPHVSLKKSNFDWLPGSTAKVVSSNPLNKEELQLIDSLFTEFSGDQPGASVMIARGDELLLCKGYGLAIVETKTAATDRTTYRIGSVSKQFTAMAVLKALDQAKLSLETNLSRIHDDFPDYGKKIKVRHLLTHQSGLPSYQPVADRISDRQITDRDVVEYLKTIKGADFEPGTMFRYSNTGYAALTEIVSKGTKTPFDDYMKKNIFEPIGMDSTMYYSSSAEIPHRAMGYLWDGKKARLNDQSRTSAIMGDGSIYTSAHDFFKWHQALNNESIVSPRHHRLAIRAKNGTNGKYGFGWFIGDNYIEHSGGTAGFISQVMRIPDQQITVAVFTNRTRMQMENFIPRCEAMLSIASEGKLAMPTKEALNQPLLPEPARAKTSKHQPRPTQR